MIQCVWNICTTQLNQQQLLIESKMRLLSKCCTKMSNLSSFGKSTVASNSVFLLDDGRGTTCGIGYL